MVYCNYVFIHFATGERNSSKWSCMVRRETNADPNKEEKHFNENITGKKPAKIVEHEDYKKTVITDAATKVQEIKNIDTNDKM